MLPAYGREVRALQKKWAFEKALETFKDTLSDKLMMPCLHVDAAVMGLDPGYRTGIKTVVISGTGSEVLATDTIHFLGKSTQLNFTELH